MPRKKGPLREKIYNKLIAEIVTGQLNPGERLSEAGLAKRFGVSRTPIREALLQLEKLGYVVHQKNVGTIVKKDITRGRARDIRGGGGPGGHGRGAVSASCRPRPRTWTSSWPCKKG